MSKWQPIETAPKDREILLWAPQPKMPDDVPWRIVVGRWEPEYWRPEEGWGHDAQWESNEYRANGYDFTPIEPTDWQPLPEPPEPKANVKTL